MYAGRKRRKAVQRGVKQAPAEGVKSNPSKRHRDRLNSELDRLSRLLPFPDDITSSLDKLSILRLSVSYLRTKNFFSIALKNHTTKTLLPSSNQEDRRLPEGELILQALNGFVLVVTSDGVIFYTSQTIQDYLGFHQTDVLHQSVFELIHTEDQQAFRHNLHWALNPPTADHQPVSDDTHNPESTSPSVAYKPDRLPPENSSFLERNFICRFRCLLDNSSGFLALNFQGRLKFLHGQNRRLDNGGPAPPQLALFSIAMPLQAPSILEIRTKNMIFRTKHKLDFTPMACDAKGKIVLGYTEAELRARGTGYQFIHAADMLYCAENHVRMIKTGESGLTVFRLLTKENQWKWVQANARLIYKNGRPDYIIATQRPLGEEEGGEHLRKRSIQLPFTFATGEALLYQTSSPVPGFSDNMVAKGKSGKAKKAKGKKVDKSFKDTLDPSSLLGAMMRQDESVYVCQPAAEPKMSYHSSLFSMQDNKSTFFASVESGGTGSAKPEASTSFDPLLATLDSLSLENEESCSNSELFNALENLRLNAEDLELLLLDERMIQVEVESDYVPSLNDLLTSDEILSYIHNSLETQTNNGNSLLPLTVSDIVDPIQGSSSSTTSVSGPYLPIQHPKYSSPILQLSQQMQQHLNSQSLQQKTPNWITDSQVSDPGVISYSQHRSVLVNTITGFQNGYWDPQQPSLEEPSQLQQHSWYQMQSECPSQKRFSTATQSQEYNYVDNMDQLFSAGSHAHVDDNNIATGSGVEFSQSNSEFQSGPATSSSYQQVYQKQPNYSWINQNSSQEQNSPFLNIYKISDPAQPHDSTYSKMENGCVPYPTSTAYAGSCPLPNNNVTTASSNMPHPPLPDLSTTGFYL
ncbi:aryl hydrocarbon receptor 1b [Trichomycterus rosablanca]|uniref:aryl hydrocarbon receptor 1b n=1 Tax=Trichomycterus rosablanca TaxID=2290929 RepID=UPI002F35A773